MSFEQKETTKFLVQKNKTKNLLREELIELSKEELADRIIQLEAHSNQLRNIISKRNEVQPIKNFSKKKTKRLFNFEKCNFRRILLRIAYLGGKYHGLAEQEDSTATVEHFLFHALTKCQLIPSRDKANYHRCGRTDKGVSASGQVISLIIRSGLTSEELSSEDGGRYNELPYCRMLNRLLPKDIRAISWIPLPSKTNVEAYSARFNCAYRTYKYWFTKNRLNINAMRLGCKYLEGSHDFRNFCKMDVANGVTSFIRHIYSAEIVAENNQDSEYSKYYLKITANAFLWHQIRCIAAILFLIGNEKEDPNIIEHMLDVVKCPQKPQYNMAVESPLNLFHCGYEIVDITDDQKEYIKSFKQIDSTIHTNDRQFSENNMDTNDVPAKDWWVVDSDELIHVIKCFHEQWTTAAIQESMIKDIIEDLMMLYNSPKSHKSSETTKDRIKDLQDAIYSNDYLTQGVKSKTHTPLLKRPTCETLESRIQHYVKKKKLKESSE